MFSDAEIASRELEITLTGRDCGLEERAPMQRGVLIMLLTTTYPAL